MDILREIATKSIFAVATTESYQSVSAVCVYYTNTKNHYFYVHMQSSEDQGQSPLEPRWPL